MFPQCTLCLLLQGLDENRLYTDEELAAFEREYEDRRRQEFGAHAQPGEVNVS